MAITGIHQLKCIITALTESDLEELITLLEVPRKLWKEEKYQNCPPYVIKYAFGDVEQSVRVRLGKISGPQDTMHPVTRETWQYYEVPQGSYFVAVDEPEGHEPYYKKVELLIHGSFFDNSSFSFPKLLKFLYRVKFNPSQLDVYYDDPEQGVTTLNDWKRVFKKNSQHCIGNMLKHSEIVVGSTETNDFFYVHVGNASSKTAFATFYVRDDCTKRFELKMRNGEQIEELLANCIIDDQEAFKAEAIKILVRNIEIWTAKSRKTKNPALYVREAFWNRFLSSAPLKEKTEKSVRSEKSKCELMTAAEKSFASLMGRAISHTKRYSAVESPEVIATKLRNLANTIESLPSIP